MGGASWYVVTPLSRDKRSAASPYTPSITPSTHQLVTTLCSCSFATRMTFLSSPATLAWEPRTTFPPSPVAQAPPRQLRLASLSPRCQRERSSASAWTASLLSACWMRRGCGWYAWGWCHCLLMSLPYFAVAAAPAFTVPSLPYQAKCRPSQGDDIRHLPPLPCRSTSPIHCLRLPKRCLLRLDVTTTCR